LKFKAPLIDGILLQRYKRFLADIRLMNGEVITAHCPNSGSMKSCNVPGSPVLISHQNSPTRKLKYTWEMIKIDGKWVGINTGHPNKLVVEAISNHQIPELAGYPIIRTEVKVGKHSRIDLVLENPDQQCYVEVKNVTLLQNKQARFPDSVTERGQKHLRELVKLRKDGNRAVIFFVVQREDAETFSPADDIDSVYGKLLRKAVQKNDVEALVYQCKLAPQEIVISHRLPIYL
jgi:sugar fermentation stimulation protein A